MTPPPSGLRPRAPAPLRRLARPISLRLRRWLLERRLLESDEAEPTLEAPVSQAVTRAQFDSPHFQRWCAEMRVEPRLHRKLWEHVYVLRVLEAHGLLREGARGVGFGVGREPIAALCAARGCEVLATDQRPQNARSWRDTGEHASSPAALDERALCPPELFERRVRFAFADMRELGPLRAREAPFDFAWSACALEHLGSLEAGLDFIRASLELLRPGGLAVHTLELNAASDGRTIERGDTVLYRLRDLRALAEELRARGHQLELSLQLGRAPEDRRLDLPPYRAAVHLKLYFAGHATTSFGLAVQRGAPAEAESG